MSQDNDPQDDAAWELLLQAREQQIDPFFPQRVRQVAVSTASRSLWERIRLRPVVPVALGFGGVAAAVAVVLVSVSALKPSVDSEPGSSIASAQDGSPQDALSVVLPAGLEEVPEVVALEEEFDDIGEFVSLASTSDISSLRDDEIERLLFY